MRRAERLIDLAVLVRRSRYDDQRGQVPARGAARNPQVVRIDAVLAGVVLHPFRGRAEMVDHLGDGEPRNRAGANGKEGVSFSAEDVIDPRSHVVADFAPIGMPGSGRHVDNANPVFWAGRREDVHDEGDAVDVAVNDVLVLLVDQLFRSRRARKSRRPVQGAKGRQCEKAVGNRSMSLHGVELSVRGAPPRLVMVREGWSPRPEYREE
jgi:hypothetical protein